MSGKRIPGPPRAHFQRGFALIAILALAALLTAFLVASALNRSSTDIANEREDRSMSALRQAKAALIAYAANEQWQNTGGATPFQPGALPCPDRDNDGIAEDHEPVSQGGQKPCNTALKRIGRFPWQTIGADDLRDASGERLWYAVSPNFLKNTPSYTNIINSDTQGQLTVTGTAAASNVVAILFAPGERLQNQSRDPANAVSYNDPANFLEQFNAVTYATFSSNSLPNSQPPNELNDRVLVITQADLMAAVEPVVAANMDRDIKPMVQDYFNKWGVYPFAMAFVSPPASNTPYKGASGQTRGLMPLTDDPSWYTWSNATVTQIIPGGTGSSTVTNWNCSISSGPSSSPPWNANCQVDYSGSDGNDRPDIKIQVFLQNISTSFADIPSSFTSPPDITMQDWSGTPLDSNGAQYGPWSAIGSFVPTQTFTTPAAATGVLTYIGRLINAPDAGHRVFITIPLPTAPYSKLVSASAAVNPAGAWFVANQWYRQTFYAVSPGYVVGGVPAGNPASCNPLPLTPSCLTVNNIPSTTNNKNAILVLAGSVLGSATRPTNNLSAYFESANLTAANGTVPFIYVNRAGNSTTLNDRVVVVSP